MFIMILKPQFIFMFAIYEWNSSDLISFPLHWSTANHFNCYIIYTLKFSKSTLTWSNVGPKEDVDTMSNQR